MACTIEDMIEGSAHLNTLSESQKQAALVFYLASWYHAKNGLFIYTPSALAAAGACFQCASPPQLDSIEIHLACLAANLAGDTLDCADVDALKESIKCLSCMNHEQLRAIEIYLRCKLNEYVS